ncbi:MAG: hypothetical protein ABS69_15410 [Nitrosomonadales bacterium SCN 54-20]|nr:MAG: hypothetical protein ABS69_15410 [Nitrosomonadales bacterium SCN 54-20]
MAQVSGWGILVLYNLLVQNALLGGTYFLEILGKTLPSCQNTRQKLILGYRPIEGDEFFILRK